jgi:hypothetical protein
VPFPATCVLAFSHGPGETTDVGSYVFAPSPWGVFDQSGNVWELLEDRVQTSTTIQGLIRGGSFARGIADAAAYSRSSAPLSATGNSGVGFRVAWVPEPSEYALRLVAAASVALCARCASRPARGGARPSRETRSRRA